MTGGFEESTEPLRRELTAHCYRMLGSWDEAEDAVQDTYLRAWRGWTAFGHRASVRTWLHRIATNVALSALDSRKRRALPSGLGGPQEPDQPEFLPPEAWIQPYADDRDDLRLAFVAGLQALTPGQRAVLLLRDVLAFPAADVAEMLDVTQAAVKSTLQRARARLARSAPTPDDVVEPRSPAAQRQLEAYLVAFQKADVAALTAVLRRDAALELVPGTRWYDGIRACVPVLTEAVGEPGDWRMEPTIANGQPAAGAYLRGEPWGLAVLDCRVDGIAAITVFGDPTLVPRFSDPRGADTR
ncbi:RNA polymerase subunit sigma-70 [Cryptosporangium aurantiacum]|uniref:RNA polymerase sigma-70 factor, ECF subfamily n=1 Tax=Cryptosporangium aurantiacum TaxID=134849 RepID=A0A1M7QTT1_9ACTN|nr:RNA polymerase subunit sigma-70 [Cryptosporangium aurantiacum]SHN35033.1 RNA polymerase sigma-70 factor, ECF subfamily [Cryptosporangium aurantiacum]